MKLFGGPVAWKASKQDTITTLSAEAELLALTNTAKELRSVERLFQGLKLNLGEKPFIFCDNIQTLRNVSSDAFHLQTRLRHVNIHQHWLRQEYQQGRVNAKWLRTAEMPADGLTKFLPKEKFNNFVDLLGMVNLSEEIKCLENSDN